MTELLVASHVDPAEWNRSLRQCGGTIFHASEWAGYVKADQPSAQPEFYTVVENDGSVAGVALGFSRRSARPVIGRFSGERWLEALPATADKTPEAVSRVLRLIESHARRQGDIALSIGSFASPSTGTVLPSLGFATRGRFEFELDLGPDEKTLWDGMDYKRRKNIKKAQRSGVEVRELPADEGVAHLRRLQAASFERVVARGGPSLGEMDGQHRDPVLEVTTAGLGRLVGAFVNGSCVSASFFTTFNGLAYHTLSGHDKTALDTQAPTLLLWEMFLRLKSEGIGRLNFGGCSSTATEESSPEHGVYTYKLAFGGRRLDCASGEKTLRPRVRRLTGMLRRALQ